MPGTITIYITEGGYDTNRIITKGVTFHLLAYYVICFQYLIIIGT